MKKNFEKYRKEENCNYPFKPGRLNYCWGYAELVDRDKDKVNIFEVEKYLCKGCEYFNDKS